MTDLFAGCSTETVHDACAFQTRRGLSLTMLNAGLVLAAGFSWAQTAMPVPNGSFESPDVSGETFFAGPVLDAWQKTPEPAGYDTNLFGPWGEKTGVFFNVPNPVPIDNMDGLQGAFLTSLPGVGFFQDYESVGGTNEAPSHEFDATFQVGRSYRLTVGLTTSSTFPVTEGATLDLRVFHRVGTNRATVADSTVTFSTNVFTNVFHLLDFAVAVPAVEPGDAWAGQHTGIEFVSTVAPNLAGGFWDLDHVRWIEFVSPALTGPSKTGGLFEFTLLSDPGAVVEILTSTNVSLAVSNWASLGTLTNGSGITNLQASGATDDLRFYTVRQLP